MLPSPTSLAMLSLAGGLLFSPASLAAESCENAQTQAQINECAGKAYHEADKVLNEAYGKITERLADAPEAKEKLKTAQRNWIAFRDAECKFATSNVEGGSMQPTILNQCLAKHTTARTESLRDYLDCEEGDVSCPVPPM